MPLISISDAQRVPLPHANFVATIYNGLPRNLVVGEGVLYGIQYELCNDQAETYGVARGRNSSVADDLKVDRC
jgi:hypothetical protein